MPGETLAPIVTGRIGWFGKLPAAGDFLRRDLPERFVSAWDAWLREGMAAGPQAHGESWQENFLRFPVWYFLRRLPAEADTGKAGNPECETASWAGILVPSVDRVGRLFPLTVAFCIPDPLFLELGIAPIEQRLDELAAMTLDVLGDDDLPAFEQATGALQPLQPPEPEEPVTLAPGIAAPPTEPDGCAPARLVESLGRQALLERLASNALFWTAAGQRHPALLLAPEPLQAETFCRLVPAVPTPVLSE